MDTDEFDLPKEATPEEYYRWLSERKLEFRHPKIKALYEYYESKRPGPDIMPSRNDLVLRDITEHLPHNVLTEVTGDPRAGPDSFFCRIFGNTLTEVFGYEMSRRLLSEYPKQERMLRTYFIHMFVTESKKPLCIYGPLMASGKDFLKTEGLFLPLSYDKERVDHILCELRFSGIS